MLFVDDAYLISKPKHATVMRGSNVTLSCRSDKHDVNWRFTAFDNSVSSRVIYANGTLYKRNSYVSYNDTLYLYLVSKQDTGIYRCEDRDEAAFAELQVLGE